MGIRPNNHENIVKIHFEDSYSKSDGGVLEPKPRESEVGFLPKCIEEFMWWRRMLGRDGIGMSAVFGYYSCYCCFVGSLYRKIFHCIKILVTYNNI